MSERLRVMIEVRGIVEWVAGQYPKSLFPDPGYGKEATPDQYTAAGCRLACASIIEALNKSMPLTPISHGNLRSVLARRALSRMGIQYLEELAVISEQELLDQKGCGVTAVNAIKTTLERVGLSLRPKHP